MGYKFINGTQKIDYGSHVVLYQSQSLSVGFWIKYLAGVSDDFALIQQADTFPVIQTKTITTVSTGFGVHCGHVLGGSFSVGVRCIPGAINPLYSLPVNVWMYFGFSRNSSARTYVSYFGSRAALVDGQTITYTPTQDPFPFGTPGQGLGPWVIGNGVNGAIIGPASYWDIDLTREQHLSMARCTLPTGVDPVHLLWWTKMFEGAADVGPVMYANTFSGTPLPEYVADDGCGSYGTGQDYRLYNA